MRILIIGGGPAAVEAAIAARQIAPDCEICICTRESCIPYRRPLLPALLAEDVLPERLFLHPAEYYEQHNITLKLDMNAELVDSERKIVTFADGTILGYDRLIAAVGSSPGTLPFAEEKIPHLFNLHDVLDVGAISARLPHTESVAVIGSGVLGLETASVLLKRPCRVFLIERSRHLMGHMLDEECSDFLHNLLQNQEKLTILTDCQVLKACEFHNKLRLELDNSETQYLDVDMAICATGLLPEKVKGLPQNFSGCPVDRFMRIPGWDGAYAAGDCASFPGTESGCYQTARLQGRIAGTNAAGGEMYFRPPVRELRSTFMNIKFYCGGFIQGSESTCEKFPHCLQKLYWKNVQITGAVLIGDVSRAGNYSRLLNEQTIS